MGAKIDIITELAWIENYREQWNRHAKDYCYVVRQVGKLQKTQLTSEERDMGFEMVWAKNIDQAIKLVKDSRPTEYGDDFIRLRELTFLEYYRDRL